MSNKKKYLISKPKTILTKKGLMGQGKYIDENDISADKLKKFLKSGILLNESQAVKMKKEAEEANKKAATSLGEIKAREEQLVKDIESFEKDKEAHVKDIESFEKDKEAHVKDIENFCQEKVSFDKEKEKFLNSKK